MKIRILFICAVVFSTLTGTANATSYSLPENRSDTVVTEFPDGVPLIKSDEDETLLDIARRHLLGQEEIIRLNQDIDRWLVKKGQVVNLANLRILPDSPHQGITLNIAEYRMYFYPPNQPGKVMSFAHGVGRQDWKTPLGQTKVLKKVKDPSWHPPESIRREHAAEGDPLPVVVPPGPHNPLGAYALYLALPGEYRIHGTDIDKIYGIGMQITHGCVRMYPEDIEKLYNLVPVGTPVYIVKQPIKVGWLNNTLYIEAHPALEGEETTLDERFASALELIRKSNNGELPEFDQQALNTALTKRTGNPTPIFERVPGATQASTLTSQPSAGVTPTAVPTSVVTPEPQVAEQPVATPEPQETEQPVTTPEPQVLDQPVVSPEPQAATETQPAAVEEPKPIPAGGPIPQVVRKASPKGYYTGEIPRRPPPAE